MSGETVPKRSALLSTMLVLAILASALICLCGLIVTAYGFILVMAPPFGPIVLMIGLAVLGFGISLLRMLMRHL